MTFTAPIAPINLVFMLEEESAKHVLETLLPRILSEFPVSIPCKCIPHQGKSDLQKSIPIKLKAWCQPGTFFVILHDQDSHDCVPLKEELKKICARQSQHSPLIRIACRELEAWYFGDLDAVQRAFPKSNATKHQDRAKYRNPDTIVCPSVELQRIAKGIYLHKGIAAKTVPQYMDVHNNSSKSFNHFVTDVRKLVRQNLKTLQN